MGTTGAHTHERTCVVCGAKADKSDLLRIVRTADGSIAFDEGGRMPGRGAYVCSLNCFDEAKPARLERALKTTVNPEDVRAVSEVLHGHASNDMNR